MCYITTDKGLTLVVSVTGVCNKLQHAKIISEQGASKIVKKISQQMAKLCQKLIFFLGHSVV